MQVHTPADTQRYARCIEASKRIRWDIERDVIRGRSFGLDSKFLPDGLSLVNELDFLQANERRLLSQIQGRTYANIFGLVERYIGAKMLEISQPYWLGNQTALEALVRFADEELKHQELFRRIEQMLAGCMPAGYRFTAEPNAVAAAVLSKCSWAVLGLTCHIELFTQVHYRQSIRPDPELSELYKDVFFFHWQEESQHAILDEMEWRREDARIDAAQRDAAVDDLIALVGAVDGLLQAQAGADAEYFTTLRGGALTGAQIETVRATLLKAYRWQYIISGVQDERFSQLLNSMISPRQNARIVQALEPIMASA